MSFHKPTHGATTLPRQAARRVVDATLAGLPSFPESARQQHLAPLVVGHALAELGLARGAAAVGAARHRAFHMLAWLLSGACGGCCELLLGARVPRACRVRVRGCEGVCGGVIWVVGCFGGVQDPPSATAHAMPCVIHARHGGRWGA